jgi:MFS family permease
MVFVFMLVNYADKAVIGLASVPIMRELGLSNTRFGELGSAFFLLFAISGIAVGFLANRVGTKILMLSMALVWAGALLPMTLVASFGLLLISRVVLGAAEGPSFPVALHAIYKWFPDRKRALPTSVVACGAAVGSGVVAPVITWVIVGYGWHAAFGVLGLAGLAWAGVWVMVATEGSIAAGAPAEPSNAVRVAYGRLLTSRTALGVFLAGFGAYWVISLNIVWLANYLMKGLHLRPGEAAWVVALPSVLQIALAPCLAGLSQRLSLRGVPSRWSRGGLGAMCVVASGAAMIGMTFAPWGAWKILTIGVTFSIGSVIFTLGSTLIAEITPAEQRAAMLGVTNSVHTLAGLCAPVVMGLLVDVGADPAAGFRTGFLYAGLLVAVCGGGAALLIDPQGDVHRLPEWSGHRALGAHRHGNSRGRATRPGGARPQGSGHRATRASGSSDLIHRSFQRSPGRHQTAGFGGDQGGRGLREQSRDRLAVGDRHTQSVRSRDRRAVGHHQCDCLDGHAHRRDDGARRPVSGASVLPGARPHRRARYVLLEHPAPRSFFQIRRDSHSLQAGAEP